MTKSQTMATAAQPAALCESHWFSFCPKMAAIMKWQAAIPMAPTNRTGLRPSRSTHITAGILFAMYVRMD